MSRITEVHRKYEAMLDERNQWAGTARELAEALHAVAEAAIDSNKPEIHRALQKAEYAMARFDSMNSANGDASDTDNDNEDHT